MELKTKIFDAMSNQFKKREEGLKLLINKLMSDDLLLPNDVEYFIEKYNTSDTIGSMIFSNTGLYDFSKCISQHYSIKTLTPNAIITFFNEINSNFEIKNGYHGGQMGVGELGFIFFIKNTFLSTGADITFNNLPVEIKWGPSTRIGSARTAETKEVIKKINDIISNYNGNKGNYINIIGSTIGNKNIGKFYNDLYNLCKQGSDEMLGEIIEVFNSDKGIFPKSGKLAFINNIKNNGGVDEFKFIVALCNIYSSYGFNKRNKNHGIFFGSDDKNGVMITINDIEGDMIRLIKKLNNFGVLNVSSITGSGKGNSACTDMGIK